MRKLKLQMQITLDGFNSTGDLDEQQWVTWDWNGIKEQVFDLLDTSDTIILGRKLAEGYIPHWQETVNKPDDPMYRLATRIVNTNKVVFTKKWDKSKWKNTVLAKGGLKDEIVKLKLQKGKDIIVYGGSSFVSSLIKEGLVDEYHFFINPIVIGKGISAFGEIMNWQNLKFIHSKTYESGIVLLSYEKT